MVIISGLLFSADNRYALVIGNGNYRDKSISALANPVNDATDMAEMLRKLGYNVTLKTNIGLREMLESVTDFSLNLRRSSDIEGFFWFAGHGLSVRNIHYMLPVDVDPVNDNIIARGSYSVDDLMEEIGHARNRTNLIVIDACRNTLLPAGDNRSVGARGLAVLAADDYRVSGNKIVYSTMAGRTAADGVPGSRNSPFAQAFISNIEKVESFDDLFLDIASETMRLTRGEQQPYAMGSFAVKSYTINPILPGQVVQAAPAPSSPISTQPETEVSRVTPAAPAPYKAPRDPTALSLDGKNVMSFGMAAGSDISHLCFGGSITFSFYEKYRNYGETFFLPNSFFVSGDFIYSHDRDIKINNYFPGEWNVHGTRGFTGGIWNLGALWKIRLGEDQRFITNFGLSFSLFTMKDNTSFVFEQIGNYQAQYTNPDFQVSPGLGIFTGLGFRFTQSVSLDLGMSAKFAFTGFMSNTRTIEVPRYAGGPNSYDLGNEVILKNEFQLPFFLIGNLGITFWLPR